MELDYRAVRPNPAPARQGQELLRRDERSRQTLIQRNMGLAPHCVRRFLDRYRPAPSLSLDMEDLVSEGFVALCSAAETWDPTRGSFATYAGAAIHNRLLKVCGLGRASGMLAIEVVSLDTPIGDAGGERLQDILVDPKSTAPDASSSTRIALEEALAELPDRDRGVVEALLAGSSLTSIAAKYGCSRQRITQIQNRAFRRLRQRLGDTVVPPRPSRRGIAPRPALGARQSASRTNGWEYGRLGAWG